MLYRVLSNLDAGKRGIIPVGELTDLHWLSPEKKQILLDVGAVSELQSPPLGVLPGWKNRAKRLASACGTAADFLEMDDGLAAELLKVSIDAVAELKANVRSFLVIKPATG